MFEMTSAQQDLEDQLSPPAIPNIEAIVNKYAESSVRQMHELRWVVVKGLS